VNDVIELTSAAPNAEVNIGLLPEVLTHAADCRCAPCRAFWWELFVTGNERDVMTGERE
jgi:hypothetical protein